MAEAKTSPPLSELIDHVTILSLLGVLAVLGAAYAISLRALPKNSSLKLRILFVWHSFDALIHFIFEGAFLYNCFFVWQPIKGGASGVDAISLAAGHDYTPPGTFFLGRADRAYGAVYGTGPPSLLWQEYAKADKRWGGADLTVISLELLTVLGDGPIAAYVCWLLTREDKKAQLWFWAVILATAELYGGFMTFAPEWLTGSPNLDTSNFLYLWIYLFFFNTLWVWLPLFVLYEAYNSMKVAFTSASRDSVKKQS